MLKNSGVLYLVPTPIGNLEDVTLRSKNILNEVNYIACEDTRNAQKFLNLINIKKATFSCHEHNELAASEKIIQDLLNGQNIAYASDAGLPCISDPGFKLVSECIKNNIKVVPLPGANAALTALIASGLETDHFYFYGFLNSQNSKKEAELEGLKKIPSTFILYEAPHRIEDTLKIMYKILGNRHICIARELTKLYEEFIRIELKDYEQILSNLKGEIVIVCEGNKEDETSISNQEIINKVEQLIKANINKKDAIVAASILLNINKNYIKKLFY